MPVFPSMQVQTRCRPMEDAEKGEAVQDCQEER